MLLTVAFKAREPSSQRLHLPSSSSAEGERGAGSCRGGGTSGGAEGGRRLCWKSSTGGVTASTLTWRTEERLAGERPSSTAADEAATDSFAA